MAIVSLLFSVEVVLGMRTERVRGVPFGVKVVEGVLTERVSGGGSLLLFGHFVVAVVKVEGVLTERVRGGSLVIGVLTERVRGGPQLVVEVVVLTVRLRGGLLVLIEGGGHDAGSRHDEGGRRVP
jgi:hypothetical protein